MSVWMDKGKKSLMNEVTKYLDLKMEKITKLCNVQL